MALAENSKGVSGYRPPYRPNGQDRGEKPKNPLFYKGFLPPSKGQSASNYVGTFWIGLSAEQKIGVRVSYPQVTRLRTHSRPTQATRPYRVSGSKRVANSVLELGQCLLHR